MIKLCPGCDSERALSEMYCLNEKDGSSCNWNLSSVVPSVAGAALASVKVQANTQQPQVCVNGHSISDGDLICGTCGGEVAVATDTSKDNIDAEELFGTTNVDGWALLRELTSSEVSCQYIAEDVEGKQGVLTLYADNGGAPDQDVYAELKRLSLSHVPECFAYGYHENQPYDVFEIVDECNLNDLPMEGDDSLREIATEIAGALRDFEQVGLRHRDLQPHFVRARTRSPLDLVVDGFGSAQLSEHDLETVAPLEQTRYMAPEVVLGLVSPASDWWSLGVMLLEKVTEGACFEGINDQAFLINAVTHGVEVPPTVDADVSLLLQGLLLKDHLLRWRWDEFQLWLDGTPVELPVTQRNAEPESGVAIELGETKLYRPSDYAIAAAQAQNWDEAQEQLTQGVLLTWLDNIDAPSQMCDRLRALVNSDLTTEVRLIVALKILNTNIPLIHRGDIVSPAWLISSDNLSTARDLIHSDAPDLLSRIDQEKWLMQLKARSRAVRERAKNLEIEFDENTLQVLELNTNRSSLARQWALKRENYPDANHPSLVAIMDRRQLTDEDLLLLLSAELSLLLSAEEVVEHSAVLAVNAGVGTFDKGVALGLLREHKKTMLMQKIRDRTVDFARCKNDTVDHWVDQFRLSGNLKLPQALVTLAIPEQQWDVPKQQAYVQSVISYFENKVTATIKRGPLTRMTISKNSTKIDITDLHSERVSMSNILDAVIGRTDELITVDPSVFSENDTLERRLHRLYRHSVLYQRDSGIDGMYLGFPFLIYKKRGATTLPRIAPILLWPINLNAQPGLGNNVSIGFDHDRSEVRLNPALESILDTETYETWQQRHGSLLGATIDMVQVLTEFGVDIPVPNQSLHKLPPASVKTDATGYIACSAVLFHLDYAGQAITEDLKALRSLPPGLTSLATMVKATQPDTVEVPTALPVITEHDRYLLVDSDPSQNQALLAARNGAGLVVEGPPGTGKSQTIVNLVSEAIGRKQAIVVVCQKQAALEVVEKRLIAEGLQDRLLKITDENKDRPVVLKAVRDQLDSINSTPDTTLATNASRSVTAEKIETVEKEFSSYHYAIHLRDEQAGGSYRRLIGELIDLESQADQIINSYKLRQAVAHLSREELAIVEEAIVPVIAEWLPSNYERSALSNLQQFHWNKETVDAFLESIKSFRAIEKNRIDTQLQSTPAFQVSDLTWFGHWLADYKESHNVSEHSLASATDRWYELFVKRNTPNAAGWDYIRSLQQSINQLERFSLDGFQERWHAQLTDYSGSQLLSLEKMVNRLATSGVLASAINPLCWVAKIRVGKLVNSSRGFNELDDFQRAIELEIDIKPIRVKLTKIASYLHLKDAKKCMRLEPKSLIDFAENLLVTLAAVGERIDFILKSPMPERAMAAANTAEEWNLFLEDCENIDVQRRLSDHSVTVLETMSQYMRPEWLERQRRLILHGDDTIAEIDAIRNRAEEISSFQLFRAKGQSLPKDAWVVLDALRHSDAALRTIPSENLAKVFRIMLNREARLAWKARLESASPVLMSNGNPQVRIKQLANLDAEMRQHNQRLLQSNIDRGSLGDKSQWESITRLRGPRAVRLREFIDRGSEFGLMELRPVWLVNPDIASRIFPLKAGMFDLIVYDEASQMPIEYALPTLYRGKSVVVSGDEKQLPPTSFFSSRVESDEAEIYDGALPNEDLSEDELEEAEHDWNRREIKDCPDLLALGRSALNSMMLKVHYRSEFRELISYSNNAFYGGNLNIPARHPDAVVKAEKPIELIHVGGEYRDQTNADEAASIVDRLAEYWALRQDQRPSIGVVSFNRKQADLIGDVIEQRTVDDAEFRHAYAQEITRSERGEDMGFFVKNVESVQGDERDIIIFSTTFGKNAAGGFRRNFGVLGQKGGERRLNVAVTRARRKIIVMCSMPIADISDLLQTRRPPASARDYLQAYLHYASVVSAGELVVAKSVLKQLGGKENLQEKPIGEIDDGFLISVGQFLKSNGYDAIAANDGTAFGLDYAIPHPEHGQFGIGIECDAPQHPILESARAREIWRPGVLKRAIPSLHRVSSYRWYHETEQEQQALLTAIESALATA